MSSTKRHLSTDSADESSGAGKRAKMNLPDTPTEGPSQASSEGTVVGDADSERYKSVTFSSSRATAQEWETVMLILERPSLAERVKEVCLPSSSNFLEHGWGTFPEYEIKTEGDRRAERILKEVITKQKWWPDDAQKLLPAAMDRDSDALAAVLLPECPNAEHLMVGEHRDAVPRDILLVDTAAPTYANTVTHLRLKACQLYHDCNYSDYSFELFQTYARLPRLTHLAMSGIGGIHVDDSGSYTEIPKYVSPVKNIIVKKSQMGTSCLRYVIRFAQQNRLESFTYQTGGMASPDTSGAIIELPSIWAALTHHSRTLRKLDLDLDDQLPSQPLTRYPEDEDDSDPDDIELEYPQLQNLTCIRIGIKALIDLMIPADSSTRLVDVLPPNVEELVIRGYDKSDAKVDVKSQLDEIKARMGTGRLSNLRILQGIDELIPNREDYTGDEDDWEDDGQVDGANIWI